MLIGKFRIDSDTENITLYKPVNRKVPGDIRWQPIAYFSNFENALCHLIDMEVMGTGLSDLKSVTKKQDELFNLLKQLGNTPERAEPCTGAGK